MDHDAARERLELAALEPGGLERLMAGDTASAQAVAAHLAGCPSCTEELARLERASTLIRDVVREMPPPDLRARTLAAIRAEGVLRPIAVGAVAMEPATITPPMAAENAPISIDRRRRAPVLGWIVTVAAAVVLSVVTTSILVGGRVDGQLATQADTISSLEEVTTATLTLTAQSDAQHVALTGASDPSATGSLAFSPSTEQLVVVATGLPSPTTGEEYRCWVEIGGTRQSLGKMHFSEDLAYWIGSAPAVSGVSTDATFGVSLVGVSGGAVEATPVLVGQL
jgi:negative regulator of sigma E activity